MLGRYYNNPGDWVRTVMALIVWVSTIMARLHWFESYWGKIVRGLTSQNIMSRYNVASYVTTTQ